MSFSTGRSQFSKKWRERWRRWRTTLITVFVTPWHMIVNGFTWVGQTLSSAWASRHFRFLIQGFPALFSIIGVGALVVNAKTIDRANLAKDYLQSGIIAAKEEKYELAQSMLEKALKLEGDKDETKFLLAIILDQAYRSGLTAVNNKGKEMPEDVRKNILEDLERKRMQAYAIMRSLAPENANGHPTAHLWMGDDIDRKYAKTHDVLRAMENHYQRAYLTALAINPTGNDVANAALRLGTMSFGLQRLDDAIKYLEIAADKHPYSRLMLAGAYQAANRPDDKVRTLRRIESYCQNKLKANINDKEARLYLATVLVQLDQFADAIEVVRAGMAHDRDDQNFLGHIADIMAAWDMKIAKNPETKITDRFTLIQQGLAARPVHGYHLSRLLEFSEMKGPEGDKARKLMEDMLVDGKQAPIIHMLMAERAYKENRLSEAQYHWEKSFALDPNFGIVANNLAWVLSHKKDPELDRALKIIEQAIQKMPGVPKFHGTRGEILSKMGRHKEALPELERALSASNREVSIHEALAETHKALGNQSMADLHRRKAEEIRQSVQKKPTEILSPTGEPVTPTPAVDKPKPEEPKAKSDEPKAKNEPPQPKSGE